VLAVLLLWGKKDRLIPFSNSADYTKLLPDSRHDGFFYALLLKEASA
jgi:hypothetical protein